MTRDHKLMLHVLQATTGYILNDVHTIRIQSAWHQNIIKIQLNMLHTGWISRILNSLLFCLN